MWSKLLLCRFQRLGEISQTQASQGFAAFRLTLSRIPPRRSQSRRATNCATPRHPAAQLHRQNIVYRFLCGSSIQKSAADSAARVAFFSWRKLQPTMAEKHAATGAFKGAGCGFGATAEKRMQKLGRVQNLLRSSCKQAGKVLS